MRMKLACGAVALVLCAPPAWAEAWDIVLINETGKTIKDIALSPAGAAVWKARVVDEEITPDKSLAAGKRTTVNFDRDAKQCRWDVKLTFADDTSAVWPGINVCTNAFVTVSYKNDAPVFAAK